MVDSDGIILAMLVFTVWRRIQLCWIAVDVLRISTTTSVVISTFLVLLPQVMDCFPISNDRSWGLLCWDGLSQHAKVWTVWKSLWVISGWFTIPVTSARMIQSILACCCYPGTAARNGPQFPSATVSPDFQACLCCLHLVALLHQFSLFQLHFPPPEVQVYQEQGRVPHEQPWYVTRLA